MGAGTKDRLLSPDDLFEMLPDGVVVVDEEERIVYLNNPVTSFLGYRPGDLVVHSSSLLASEGHRDIHQEQFLRFQLSDIHF